MASRLPKAGPLGTTTSGAGSSSSYRQGGGYGYSYSDGGPPAATKAQLEEVARTVRATPVIDNHAHPLLKPEALGTRPLMSIVTEATGDAIHSTSRTLAHQRAVRQLSRVLACPPTWESVVAAIESRRVDVDAHEQWVATCLAGAGIDAILLDDGLDHLRRDEAQDVSWHDNFVRGGVVGGGFVSGVTGGTGSAGGSGTRTPAGGDDGGACRRIVRIEAVAAELIDAHAQTYDASQSTDDVFDHMLEEFDTCIKQAIEDPDVVGFKSVICYRTGLGIPKVVDIAAARDSFGDVIEGYGGSGPFTRLNHEGLNELFVHHTAVLIRENSGRFRKPIQFHTGLGDNDITLAKSSPSLLQEFIRAYPSVPIILLHASYPFTREAGYLASVYANVHVDIGEVFPIVSQDGQEAVLRQVLELCPWSKILWSSDGHWFPETYLLATIQGREALESVLCDMVRKGQLSWKAAIELTRDVLFRNANKLYHLDLPFAELTAADAAAATAGGAGDDADHERSDLEILDQFLASRPIPSFVRICWLDLTATPRMRMIPYKKFLRVLEDGGSPDIGIPKAALGMLQNDALVPGVTATGEYRLHPDFSSLKSGPINGHVSMYGEFREQDGSRVVLCPRSQLARAVEVAARAGLTFQIGFEVEFVLMHRSMSSSSADAEGGGDGATTTGSGDAGSDKRVPRKRQPRYSKLVNDGHAWSNSRYFADPQVARLLRDMVSQLEAIGVDVEQVHAESAAGQFELALPAQTPLEAVDTLLHVRETLVSLATAAGYKLSLHPKPFVNSCGTASHVHISISSPQGSRPEVYESFYAGILAHLPALLAFTCSSPASYERLADGFWAGGRWVTWGTQNREAPLRKIEASHWEFKCIDGLANPYLALAALLLCGVDGVRSKRELVWGDCEMDPSGMTENDRHELGVTEMLPATLEEAFAALADDDRLEELLSSDLIERYTAVKEAELKLLGGMSAEDRREWILERY